LLRKHGDTDRNDEGAEREVKAKLTKLSIAESQATYREVFGRETRSSDSASLVC
jgi:hypothetical protein